MNGYIWSFGGDNDRGMTRKTCPGATVPTTKPTWSGLGLQEQRHMINLLRRGKASIILISHTKGSYIFRKVDILTPITFIIKRELQTLITTPYTYSSKNLHHRTDITSSPP
jgi:hypothetical protein